MKFKLVPILLLLTGCSSGSNNIPLNTVKITNLAGNAGGSGSIISHKKSESSILTNAHVCGVVKNGGLVHTTSGQSAMVVSYKTSSVHDLCVLTVAKDLGFSAEVSSSAPKPYDEAIVSGHPRLLPNIITKGHFSGKMLITLVTDVQPCDGKEENPQDQFFCQVFGVKPTIKTFETIVVSATIQPGSSGSAVYNKDGEISAVIFAGAGDFGYGVAVPLEYVQTFLDTELRMTPKQTPELKISGNMSSNRHSDIKDLIKKCETLSHPEKDKYCGVFKDTVSFSNLME